MDTDRTAVSDSTGIEVVLDSFDRNSRVNEIILDTLEERELDLDDGAGGWNVRMHLAHLAEFRRDWLSWVASEFAAGLPQVAEYDQDEGMRLLQGDLHVIRAALKAGDEAVRAAVINRIESGRSLDGAYGTHPAHFLQHTIVHDSHHRGHLMGLLRRGGRTPQQMGQLEDATWSIWNEAS